MSDLERRGSYTPRRVREQRAYRLAVVGGIAGVIGVAGIVSRSPVSAAAGSRSSR